MSEVPLYLRSGAAAVGLFVALDEVERQHLRNYDLYQ
jgi:hypothetical protein